MNTLSDLTTRIRAVLQDDEALLSSGKFPAWQSAEIRSELDQALMTLARRHLFQSLIWVNAIASRSIYPLNEWATQVLTGTDNSGGTGTIQSVTDTTQNFVTSGVSVGDRVRNLTDGCRGLVTAVEATVLTCLAGFTGGDENAFDSGDQYVVEHPLTPTTRVVSIEAVLYDGQDLYYTEELALDRLRPGWELRHTGPIYWSVDNAQTPTVLRIMPSPVLTGSTVPVFPESPLLQDWRDNLVVVASIHPQESQEPTAALQVLDAYEDALVYDTIARFAGMEGEWQTLGLSTVMQALAQVYSQQLGIRHV